MVDHHRGDTIDGSRGISSGVASAVAAVGAVAATATTAQAGGQGIASVPMQRVLSAPLLSPAGGSSDGTRPRRERMSGSGGLDSHSHRLPSLRQVL